jgi:hypothetical protein
MDEHCTPRLLATTERKASDNKYCKSEPPWQPHTYPPSLLDGLPSMPMTRSSGKRQETQDGETKFNTPFAVGNRFTLEARAC